MFANFADLEPFVKVFSANLKCVSVRVRMRPILPLTHESFLREIFYFHIFAKVSRYTVIIDHWTIQRKKPQTLGELHPPFQTSTLRGKGSGFPSTTQRAVAHHKVYGMLILEDGGC